VVAVRLQLDRCSVVFPVERMADVERAAFELEVILHQHPFQEDCDIGRSFQLAILVERWGGPYHVVSLPFPGPAIRVHQRNVYTPGLAVDVPFIIVTANTWSGTAHACRSVIMIPLRGALGSFSGYSRKLPDLGLHA
jgi:hypothetical protein